MPEPLPLFQLAHDLRQPLRTMLTQAQMAAEMQPAPEVAKALREIVAAGRRQEHLLAAAVEYEAAGVAPALTPMPLSLVLRQAGQAVEAFRAERQGRLVLPENPPVARVAAAAAKALEKVLHNALKFHAPGERPEVHVDAQAVDVRIVIRVRDAGVGIEPQYLEKIFQPFARLHPAADFPGTGLQLAIARLLLAAADGEVRAVPSSGGALFEISVPALP
jgi:signal transduction histidine kinase